MMGILVAAGTDGAQFNLFDEELERVVNQCRLGKPSGNGLALSYPLVGNYAQLVVMTPSDGAEYLSDMYREQVRLDKQRGY